MLRSISLQPSTGSGVGLVYVKREARGAFTASGEYSIGRFRDLELESPVLDDVLFAPLADCAASPSSASPSSPSTRSSIPGWFRHLRARALSIAARRRAILLCERSSLELVRFPRARSPDKSAMFDAVLSRPYRGGGETTLIEQSLK